MNITELLLLIVLEIGIVAAIWCASLVLRHFSPKSYAAHICANVDKTIPQRCFDCNEATCEVAILHGKRLDPRENAHRQYGCRSVWRT
jgi:hypothetical protein